MPREKKLPSRTVPSQEDVREMQVNQQNLQLKASLYSLVDQRIRFLLEQESRAKNTTILRGHPYVFPQHNNLLYVDGSMLTNAKRQAILDVVNSLVALADEQGYLIKDLVCGS